MPHQRDILVLGVGMAGLTAGRALAEAGFPVTIVEAGERIRTLRIHNTLFFAGEHTDTTGHWGTVHEAIRSG